MENVYIMNHPLIQHKISMLRNKNTGTNEFRKLVEEIGILMGYEALRDLPVENVEVETPIETCMTPMISGKKLAVIPVLRAGLGMVNSILTLVPSAKVGHVGLYRDPVTHEPHEYYCKLPEAIDERISVIVDPMLATGGSAEAAVDFVKKQGGKNIKFMCIIAAPEGLKRLHEAHPDVQIYCGHLDRELNDHAYICQVLEMPEIVSLAQYKNNVIRYILYLYCTILYCAYEELTLHQYSRKLFYDILTIYYCSLRSQ